jgi:hypothetical protein
MKFRETVLDSEYIGEQYLTVDALDSECIGKSIILVSECSGKQYLTTHKLKRNIVCFN